ncbi:MAG: SUMF1/EgtB/PvdO family nonheme iron enzyme [Candidatus Sericytochromatia bacterium]
MSILLGAGLVLGPGLVPLSGDWGRPVGVWAQAEKRVALVIGNGDYKTLGRLANPVNDAREMARTLEKLGFRVVLRENVPDVDQFLAAMHEFSSQLTPDSVALIFYAGHGVQVNGINYLIPTQVQIASEREIPYRALNLDDLIQTLQEGKSRLNILVLDACRDNPFVQSSRSLQRGLAIVQNQPNNFLVAYATAPGKTASDGLGTGEHGLFTQELLKAIATPGLSIEQVFKRVRINVKQLSHDQQVPEERSVLTEDFFFAPAPGEVIRPTPVPFTRPSPEPTPRPTAQGPPTEIIDRLGMKFNLIPAGSFLMGSPNNEIGRESDERQHQVTIARPFYLQTTELTQGQWQAVMGFNPAHFNNDPNLPVENVSFEDVQSFIQRLNDRQEGRYRLPTEAEWEYAARSGSSAAWAFGPQAGRLDAFAWFSANAEGRTHKVASKSPNAWGLYDMYGNVWEWVADWYGEYPDQTVPDPMGPAEGSFRVVRGGAWFIEAPLARSAVRGRNAPGYKAVGLGFRLVREP